MLLLDKDVIVAGNARAETLVGRTDLTDSPLSQVFAAWAPPSPDAHRPVEVLVTRQDGSQILAAATTNTVQTPEGPRTLVALRAATPRPDQDASWVDLEKREKRFEEAQSVAHIGSWEWDIPTNTVTWTDELYRLYGLEPQSAYIDYERYMQLIHPEDREAANAVVQEAFQTLAPFDFEHRLIRPDGSIQWLRGRGDVFANAEGAPVRMVGTAQDITDQKEAQIIVANSLQEKELLLKEVHHRVKNNLQIVTSLLRMQGRKTPDPRLLSLLRESRARIRSMALVHEKLYHSKDLTRLDAADYLHDLAADIRKSLSFPAGMTIQTEVSTFPLSLDRAVTLGLLTNELVANSFKHAFPDGKGQVLIRAGQDTKLFLEISDDGVGLPSGFDARSPESLGMRLVHTLVEQLGGTLTWNSDHGTTFRIEAEPE